MVAKELPSPSLRFGHQYQLNTWNKGSRTEFPPTVETEQHPGLLLSPADIDSNLFSYANTLSALATASLYSAVTHFIVAQATRITTRAQSVTTTIGAPASGRQHSVNSRAVIVCPGLSVPHLPETDSLKFAKQRGKRVLHFYDFLQTVNAGISHREKLLVVGSGPSGLAAMELLLQHQNPRIQWVLGRAENALPWNAPDRSSGVTRMLCARYSQLQKRLTAAKLSGQVEIYESIVHRVRLVSGHLVVSLQQHISEKRAPRPPLQVDTIIWCAGLGADFSLVGRAAQTACFSIGGLKVAMQRKSNGLQHQIYGLGPGLDQLGYGQWDTGPMSEWVTKGQLLLRHLQSKLFFAPV